MALRYATVRRALEGEALPCLLLDEGAFDRNVARVMARARDVGRTVRIATKSLRVPSLYRRILAAAPDVAKGLLCYSAREAAFLADQGFDDLLVAYPAWQDADLDALARAARSKRVRIVVDSEESLVRLAVYGTKHGIALPAVLCIDMSFELLGGAVHLGVRRSPLRTPADVAPLVARARGLEGVAIVGLLAYEAQIAGLADAEPTRRARGSAVRAFKELSWRELVARRAAIVDEARRLGLALELVNGGGTGSLEQTLADPSVTEVTVGSGFFKPALFDGYRAASVRELEPACFFALEVTRVPAKGYATCFAGGYIASGPPGADRAPLPWLPEGLALLPDEGAGEVQTPLRLPEGALLDRGDPVVFRAAKSGEICEHFQEMLLLHQESVVERAPTYRGLGKAFG
jgi:D-serine deaminase-like pyridoxal phosphate-dependent protein